MRVLPARLNDKPQYVFHPARAFRRAMHGRSWSPGSNRGLEIALLPWGLPLEVHAGEAIGLSIVTGGVFDPCVSEAMHRLVDPGDLVADVGANQGYLTSLAAARTGSSGCVLAFEPHPRVYSVLARNVERWTDFSGVAPVEARQIALSDTDGIGTLSSGSEFEANMGLAALKPDAVPDGKGLLPVTMSRLDDIIGDRIVGLIKIDVEGHETEVLRGAVELLHSGRVRDVIFEDHHDYPDDATKLVEGAGLHLFSLANDLFGLEIGVPADRGETPAWPGPSYLATRDPQRALDRLRPRGWRIAGIGPSFTRGPSRRRSG